MTCSHVPEGEYCPNARCQEEAQAQPRTLTDALPIVARWPDPIPFSEACIAHWKWMARVTPGLGGMTDTTRYAPKDDHEA
jgi:hypothetical protein